MGGSLASGQPAKASVRQRCQLLTCPATADITEVTDAQVSKVFTRHRDRMKQKVVEAWADPAERSAQMPSRAELMQLASSQHCLCNICKCLLDFSQPNRGATPSRAAALDAVHVTPVRRYQGNTQYLCCRCNFMRSKVEKIPIRQAQRAELMLTLEQQTPTFVSGARQVASSHCRATSVPRA